MMGWRTAREVRAGGKRVPDRIGDDDLIRYVDGFDPDGEPLQRLEVKPPEPESDEHRMLRQALNGWARAVRERYECGATGMACGGVCHRPIGHEPPCYCTGVDENGEETCPA